MPYNTLCHVAYSLKINIDKNYFKAINIYNKKNHKPQKSNVINTKSKLYLKTIQIKSFNTDHINQPQNDHSNKKKRRKNNNNNILPSEGSVVARERGRATKMKEKQRARGKLGRAIAFRSVVQVRRGTCRVSWRRKKK